ncbi:MAG: DDE-type integrase/transposase/recombinase, partial [Solirubrobacteraceae bacterium]
DFTYLRTWEGRMFFAFLIDVFSRMIVGWQLACHMRTDLVLDAMRMALGTRRPGADVQLARGARWDASRVETASLSLVIGLTVGPLNLRF